MDVFHHILEAVEAFSFGCHHFGGEIAAWVLVDNAIRGSEERENMGDEVVLIGR